MIQDPTSTAPCFLCQMPTVPEPHPILGEPVCTPCLTQGPARAANERCAGTGDGLPMFSVEFEVCSCEASRRAYHALVLLKYGYLRAYDCTVSDEYKSPRYLDLAAFQDVLPTLESLVDLVDGCCGTHIHIDCPVQPDVKAHSHALFSPLATYLDDHREETRQFWGRAPYTLLWISTRYPTVEFRLPRFRSAEHYLAVVQFCRAAGQILNQRFTEDHTASSLSPQQIGEELLLLYRQQLSQSMLLARREAHV